MSRCAPGFVAVVLAVCGCSESDSTESDDAATSFECVDLLGDPRLGDAVEVLASFEAGSGRTCTLQIGSPEALSELEVVDAVCPEGALVAITVDTTARTWTVDLAQTEELNRANC